jgi:hypothetical protein
MRIAFQFEIEEGPFRVFDSRGHLKRTENVRVYLDHRYSLPEAIEFAKQLVDDPRLAGKVLAIRVPDKGFIWTIHVRDQAEEADYWYVLERILHDELGL